MNHRNPLGLQCSSYLVGELQRLQRLPKAAAAGEDEIECIVLEGYRVSLAFHHQGTGSLLRDTDGVLHAKLSEGENLWGSRRSFNAERLGNRGEKTIGDEVAKDGGVELNGFEQMVVIGARGGRSDDGDEIGREGEEAEVAAIARFAGEGDDVSKTKEEEEDA